MVKFLQRHGWVAREGGRHTVMAKDGVLITVPRHTTLKTGTVNGIIKEAGLEQQAVAEL